MFQGKMNSKLRLILVLFITMFIVITLRVMYIELIDYNKLYVLANDLWSRDLPIQGDRGLILDRNGVVLADNITTTSLVLIPNQIEDKELVSQTLANILNVSIDEMRKQFISDVSHELKTPIALIQGYAEGLVENVNTDEENKNFYANVILDEANKMDKLVKRLLELMKLEYEDIDFNDTNFDIVEVIREIIRISKVQLEEAKINVVFDEHEPIYVFADDFYIEQVVTNYFTNAIKNNNNTLPKFPMTFGNNQEDDFVNQIAPDEIYNIKNIINI
mgnify:CR=1 FL=1